MFSPRLCNKNKKNKCEQINRKQNTHQQYKHTSNINNTNIHQKKKKEVKKIIIINQCVFMDVCSVLLLSCLYICVCAYLQMQVPLPECCLMQSGVCGPLSYCAPLVCVPPVIGVLTVWWHNQKTVFHVFEVRWCTICA